VAGDPTLRCWRGLGFLLLLPSMDLRDRVLSCDDGVSIGRAKLQLIP
jgi:hypothetical protein